MLHPHTHLGQAASSAQLGQHHLPYFHASIFANFPQLITASFGTQAGNAAYAHAGGDLSRIAQITHTRQRICHRLNIPFYSLFPPNLTRGKEELIVEVTRGDLDVLNKTPRPQRVEAHAVITSTPGIALMMNTADCSATTLYDPVRNVLAMVHTGYQGALKQTLPRTIAKMSSDFGCQTTHILAALSPSITAQYFTDPAPAQKDMPDWQPYLHHTANGHTAIDLRGYLVAQMQQAGLKAENIDNSAPCTASTRLPSGEFAYYSYHRDRTTARMANIACLAHNLD